MKTMGLALTLALACASAHGAGDLTRQEPTRVTMVLGTAKGEHRFSPDSLTLETGKLYVLRLENPSANEYYFGSQGLADAVYSRKVVVLGADAKAVAEVYGPVRRVELKPGSVVEWWFLPVRTGRFEDVMSTRTHTEAGMRATIEVK
ncbi:hypothetical protein C1M51_11090 [Methylibium sp. Pch-M]|uniref:hypothetical protein n=1 Tax=Methylibium sp. Pch-M TaxID=2082386 RepID=UPI001011AAF2|nr:hypothetical protein [Methylibium sp. Pch-M]QAZ39915.1 hypothetical protein C1M51_11090 [Methylibium sp. Pch-M]